MPDIYALTYLSALAIVGAVTLWRAIKNHDTLRLLCILVMWLAWLATQQAQIVSRDYMPMEMFFLIESATIILFSYIAYAHQKLWVWWLGAIYAGILGLDLAFVAGGQLHAYSYLSAMTALSYIAMLWILFGETTLQVVGGWLRDGLGLVFPWFARANHFHDGSG